MKETTFIGWIMLVTFAMLLTAAALPAHGADANFSWTPNPPENKVLGYKIHYGTKSGVYTEVVDQNLPPVKDGKMYGKVTGLEYDVPYFFAATAYNASGSSKFTAEVPVTLQLPVPDAPGDFAPTTVVINISNVSKVKLNINGIAAN